MKEKGLDIFFETSAKTGHNVKDVFYEAAKQILDRQRQLKGAGIKNGRP